MREIKFRAWHKKTQRMHHSKELDFVIKAGGILPKDYDFMQYTGLKDKNGKEIYEGDILDSIMPGGYTFRVGWNDSNCRFLLLDINSGSHWRDLVKRRDLVKHELVSMKVIGNIYENPELLEK